MKHSSHQRIFLHEMNIYLMNHSLIHGKSINRTTEKRKRNRSTIFDIIYAQKMACDRENRIIAKINHHICISAELHPENSVTHK